MGLGPAHPVSSGRIQQFFGSILHCFYAPDAGLGGTCASGEFRQKRAQRG
jgi:hypothetical protein